MPATKRKPVNSARRLQTSAVSVSCVETLSAPAVYPGSGLVVDPAQKHNVPVLQLPVGSPHDNQKSGIKHFAVTQAVWPVGIAAAD
jgi:hypothetical protein